MLVQGSVYAVPLQDSAQRAQLSPSTRQTTDHRPASAWQRLTLRESTKGKLQVEVVHRRVWTWDGKEAQARHWHLIIRREVKSPGKLEYTLSNAPEETS